MTVYNVLPDLLDLTIKAGNAIMDVYRQDFSVKHKTDASPVTEADEIAEAIILDGLRRVTPDIPVISEEAASSGTLPDIDDVFWLVDPLDGTREFIKRNGEFTVNLGLVCRSHPLFGIIYAPAQERLFWTSADGLAMTKNADGSIHSIAANTIDHAALTVLTSRSHRHGGALGRWLADHPIANELHCGSSLKLCMIAAGEADAYPRFGPTSEWDIAAGHAILLAAGGSVETLDGAPLTYGKADYLNPDFIAWGKRT